MGIEIEDQAFTGFVESANANALACARWEKATPGGWLAVATFGVTEYMSDASVGVLDIETRDRRHSWRADVSRITPAGTVRVGTDGGRSRNAWAGRVPETRGDLGGVAGSSVFDVTLADRHAGAYAEFEGRPGVLVPSLGVRVDRFLLARATTVDPAWACSSGRAPRFASFPLVEDDDLGLARHPFDLATNKVLALVGRLEVRDWVDVLACDAGLQPLGSGLGGLRQGSRLHAGGHPRRGAPLVPLLGRRAGVARVRRAAPARGGSVAAMA